MATDRFPAELVDELYTLRRDHLEEAPKLGPLTRDRFGAVMDRVQLIPCELEVDVSEKEAAKRGWRLPLPPAAASAPLRELCAARCWLWLAGDKKTFASGYAYHWRTGAATGNVVNVLFYNFCDDVPESGSHLVGRCRHDGAGNCINPFHRTPKAQRTAEKRKWVQLDVGEAMALHRDGLTDTEIGNKLGVVQSTVSRALDTALYEMHYKAVMTLRGQGVSEDDIGKQLGIDQATVARVLRTPHHLKKLRE